jgi:hypothetical protein
VRYFFFLKFLVATLIFSRPLPSEFLHICAYGIYPRPKGTNRDEKKRTWNSQVPFVLDSWWQNALLTSPFLQNFLPPATIFLPPAFSPPQRYKARRKQIDLVATY